MRYLILLATVAWGLTDGEDNDVLPNADTGNADCLTKDGTNGICVAHYLCSSAGKDITDGSTLIDPRFGVRRDCPHYLQVCCRLEDRQAAPPLPKMAPKTCGWSEPLIRINNGTYANYGEYPWMVAILKRTSGNGAWSQSEYIGGGTIIHPQVVLTTAHKVMGKTANEFKCRAGEWDMRTKDEMYPHQERNVKKIVQHANFDIVSLLNDVALLVLETPYTLNSAPHIGVACLSRQPPMDNARCQSMGWGTLSDNEDEDIYARVLKKVSLPWVAPSSCEDQLRQTRLRRLFQLDPSLTCAGGETQWDTCTGDGGAPLVCPIATDAKNRTRFAVYGLVAYGIGCGTRHVPGVYANVPHLYQWIGRNMADEGFSTSSYTYN